MSIPIWQVDAFTSVPFHGNPAAVCFLEEFPDDHWLQNVAAEMNLSETAFIVPRGGDFNLRWFTPAAEVRLCGHATLASSHALWEIGTMDSSEAIRFHTLSGELTARRRDELIELDFPARPPQEVPNPPPGLIDALGIDPAWVGRDAEDFIVVVTNEKAVRAVTPDFKALQHATSRGIMVTAPAEEAGIDFVSRFFAPTLGIDEDPVTGSAHCCLTPYWAERLGRSKMVAYQASARGGTVQVELVGDRVRLGGRAVTTVRGELLTYGIPTSA